MGVLVETVRSSLSSILITARFSCWSCRAIFPNYLAHPYLPDSLPTAHSWEISPAVISVQRKLPGITVRSPSEGLRWGAGLLGLGSGKHKRDLVRKRVTETPFAWRKPFHRERHFLKSFERWLDFPRTFSPMVLLTILTEGNSLVVKILKVNVGTGCNTTNMQVVSSAPYLRERTFLFRTHAARNVARSVGLRLDTALVAWMVL